MRLKPRSNVGLYDSRFERESCGIGFVAQINKEPSHQNIKDALSILCKMDHRGARGAEPNSGDGAGILTGMPHAFFAKISKELYAIDLLSGSYSVGNIFLPNDEDDREACKTYFEETCRENELKIVGWRILPTDTKKADIGPTALDAMPQIEQVLIVDNLKNCDQEDFEKRLYLTRKKVSNHLRAHSNLNESELFYVCSLSSKTIVYKGMLTCDQVGNFFSDLSDPDFMSHLAMVHSRFSTNTFPSWDRAMPNRYMSHNGEINTIEGNINWMRAREGNMESSIFGDRLKELFPIVEPNCSDSGNFDNVLEFLALSGRSLEESVLMMVPEAWQKKKTISKERKAYYEFQSNLMEPWDGPAAIAFTNGDVIGAVLDRNGLRPSRYYLTTDNRVIMASEVGVLDIPDEEIIKKGRLEPGKIFLIDFNEGKLLSDSDVKEPLVKENPYRNWLHDNRFGFRKIKQYSNDPLYGKEELLKRMRAFGYTSETLEFMLLPMVHDLRDPLGSMGNDTVLASMSDKHRLMYDYFKQRFAQVSNPAIDSIREKIVMSLECYIGPEGNLLEPSEKHANRILVENPILTNTAMYALKHLDYLNHKSKVIDITYEKEAGINKTIKDICSLAEEAVDDGIGFLVLSDRGMSENKIPLSTLMACGAVHHHLVRTAKRSRAAIVVETGEAREVHHFCLLFGYGADAINPYLAYEILMQAKADNVIKHTHYKRGPENRVALDEYEEVIDAYRQAAVKGILKVMGKMGISTLQSYKGAQIFEAIGLSNEVIEQCFEGTVSKIGGIGFDTIEHENALRHSLGWPEDQVEASADLPNPGDFHWRSEGEKKGWNPETVWSLQLAARTNDENAYDKFSKLANKKAEDALNIRGLLKFNYSGENISINDIEPASEIVKRFCTGAMSFGSISPEAHETLAVAMNRIGGKSNSGEGGEDPARYEPMKNGDSKSSAIKQIASGRFGVTANYIANAKQLQIKIAQGAKPGEGGELPGRKVDEKIASIRYSTPGVGLISPPPHHDIYSIEDLAQLIFDLKNGNPTADISVKLVAESGVGTIAAGVAKAHADHIVISGDVGGTGASPLTSIKNAGMPWELGLAEVHQTLIMNGLRSRVMLQTDGGLKTGRDVVIAALLGAEEFGFATAPLISLGCIMMRKCHLNTCPVGIATQNKILRQKFTGQPEHVINYLFLVAEEARNIMAKLGIKSIDELVGRTELLSTEKAEKHWKSSQLDLSPLLLNPNQARSDAQTIKTAEQDHDIDSVLDHELIDKCQDALNKRNSVEHDFNISNLNRTTGAMLSHEIAKRWDDEGLPEDSIRINFSGSAGQSFGAFLSKGVTFNLTGDANDYVGKSLSGGKIIVHPPENSAFKAEENILIGNVALYGATSGFGFFRGIAAERFCVRNSGAWSVVEGVGDHGCEYMTGGRVVVLGETGVNFAAGMSGGIAYVYDPRNEFSPKCNTGMVELEPIGDETSIAEILRLIELHHEYTDSLLAEEIMDDWDNSLEKFVKVMPIDYKRVMNERAEHNEEIESIFDVEDRKSQRKGV
ncbi:glutamate synthase large subunit [Gammaproteobacteria bacterium]|nr:glutamate synthase large subunit [Gammaproteobacteria bacterium]